jgi:hypothetical protein
MNRRHLLVMLLSVAGLAGCAHLAPPEADTLAKLLQPVPSKAVIFVLRNEPASAPWRMKVVLDGQDMGSTSANTYFRWVVEPGRHLIISETQNDSGVVVDAQAGQIYYIWQDVSTGFFRPRADLRFVDRQTAEAAMRSSYLLASGA